MDKKTVNTNRYYLSGNLQNVLDSKQIICYCINMGLPRSWWEDSVRHIQFPIVEHNSQFKAFPVSVSPGLYPQQSD
ncbi:hypothetical protein F8C14_13200, partial [Escherichia coli]|nr:hypothetical protein [Escherichia coli]